jgi:hypothetical protein
MRWVVRSRNRRMARNVLRLEAWKRKISGASSDDFSVLRRASSLTLCQIRTPGFQSPPVVQRISEKR